MTKKSYSLILVTEKNLDQLNIFRNDLELDSRTLDYFKNDENRVWMIVESGEQKALGIITIVPSQDEEKEIGFVLLPQERGKGILSTILPDFIKYLGLPLYAETSVGNHSAIRLLEKCGFQLTKTKHGYHQTAYGETVKSVAYRYHF